MAVAYDSAASSSNTAASSLTFAHTMVGSTNLAIGVGVSHYNSVLRTVSSVTYNAEALTSQIQQTDTSDGDNAVQLFAKATASGSGNVVVTMSDTCNLVVGSVGVTGCDQTTPISNTAQNHDWTFADAAPTVTCTTAAGELVMDCLDGYSTDVVATVGADQTSRWNTHPLAGVNIPIGAGSTQLGSAGGVMSWSLDAAKAWTILAMSFKAAAAGGRTSKNIHPWTLGVQVGMGIGLPGGSA